MEGFVTSFLLAFPRTLGFSLLFPGSFTVFPISGRIIFALVLTVLFGDENVVVRELAFFEWPFLIFQEGIFGAIIVFPLKLTVDAVTMWAQLIDQGRGQQLGASYGGGEDHGSPHAMLLQYGIIVSLFSTGVVLEVFSTFHESFSLFPAGELLLHLSGVGVHLLNFIFQILHVVFLWFLPLGILFLLSDLGLGVISKLVPGMPVFGEIFVSKTFLLGAMYLFVFIPTFDTMGDTFFFIGEQFLGDIFEMGMK